MLFIEVQHLDSTILSLKVNKEFTVENLKHLISQNIHIPASDLTLASNGSLLEDGHRISDFVSGDVCKILLFLRRGEQIRINIVVDFGNGKVIHIPVCTSWTVGELKQKLLNEIKDETLEDNKLLGFAYYIMEDDRTLEEYRVKEGSMITVFSYLNQKPSNKKVCNINKKNEKLDAEVQESTSYEPHSHLEKETSENGPTSEPFGNNGEVNLESSLSCKIPLLQTPPQPIKEPKKVGAVGAQPRPILLPTASPIQPQISESSNPLSNFLQHPDDPPLNGSANMRNGSESTGSWPAAMEPKTIVIPGGFRQRPGRSVFSRQFPTGNSLPESNKSLDKMDVIFFDGSRKMTVELPIAATVGEGLEAVKARISDTDKEKLRLFKGYVQMKEHHLLSQYGVVHGSTVVFKKTEPIRKF